MDRDHGKALEEEEHGWKRHEARSGGRSPRATAGALLTLTTFAGDTGYVEEVVVDKAARGQHISTALMQSLLDLAAQKGPRFVD